MGFLRDIFGRKDKEAPPPVASEMGMGPERRKFERTATDLDAYLGLPSGKQIRARVMDISEGGVKVAVQMTLEIGSRVELILKTGETVAKALMMLKWELYDEGDYVYGAEFFMTDSAHRAAIMKVIKSAGKGKSR